MKGMDKTMDVGDNTLDRMRNADLWNIARVRLASKADPGKFGSGAAQDFELFNSGPRKGMEPT